MLKANKKCSCYYITVCVPYDGYYIDDAVFLSKAGKNNFIVSSKNDSSFEELNGCARQDSNLNEIHYAQNHLNNESNLFSQCLQFRFECNNKHAFVAFVLDSCFTSSLITCLRQWPAVLFRFSIFCWNIFGIRIRSGITIEIFVRQPTKFFLDYLWYAIIFFHVCMYLWTCMHLSDALNRPVNVTVLA